MQRGAKILLGTVTILLLLTAGIGIFGPKLAANALKERLEKALGPESEVSEIIPSWSGIEIRNIRIHAPQGWPAEDTLRASKIVIEPDIRSLLSSNIRIRQIMIEGAYLSILRSKEGKLRLIPNLLEKKTDSPSDQASTPAATEVQIGHIELKGGELDFYDASIRTPPHELTIQDLNVKLDDLRLPQLDSKTQLALDGVIKGVRQNGKASIKGWMVMSNRDSEIKATLSSVDLLVLQPYLLKATETGIKKGVLDLSLKSSVNNNRLKAPGTVTLRGLELGNNGNFFMGLSRQAVIGALKNKRDQIILHFALDGNLSDPSFSLNESFSKRLGTGMAEKLGIGLTGLTKSVGGATESVGGTLRKIFKR